MGVDHQKMRNDVSYAIDKLEWMRDQDIWPGEQRYLWTDALGVLLLCALARSSGERRWVQQAESVVAEVERVLGRERGLRIGEGPGREGQYYHYLAMWIHALTRLGELEPRYRARALGLVREIHESFVLPGTGVIWKMREDLSGPWPGYGLGALDPFHGMMMYRLLDAEALADEIAELDALVRASADTLVLEQDLGLGMMLWLSHFAPGERWARVQRERSLRMLDTMWLDDVGCFCRHPGARDTCYAFTNYGISVGLQAVGAWPQRVARLHTGLEPQLAAVEPQLAAITAVMACCAHLPSALVYTPHDVPGADATARRG